MIERVCLREIARVRVSVSAKERAYVSDRELISKRKIERVEFMCAHERAHVNLRKKEIERLSE